MAKSGFKLNSAGLVEVMKSAEMQSVVNEAAASMAAQASAMSGGEFETSSGLGRDRAYAKVSPADKTAWKDNMDNNVLLKAMESVSV